MTRGWRPIDARLRITDVPRIVDNLGGSALYGNDPTVPPRELIQNAADAIRARGKLEEQHVSWGTIIVSLVQREDGDTLTVEDDGVGMSESVLTGPLLDFGASFWHSTLVTDEFPGLLAAGMKPAGRFGIGFFSVFTMGSQVKVFSRRFDRGIDEGRLLEFADGTAVRPLLSRAEAKDLPRSGGTRVEVTLRRRAKHANGLLSSGSKTPTHYTLSRLVGAIAPSMDVKIVVREGEEVETIVEPNDWISVSEARLIRRLDPTELEPLLDETEEKSTERMTTITGVDGKVCGRALIDPTYLLDSRKGWVTVAGLRACPLSHISGILEGEVMTVARDVAKPLVDMKSLGRWASEQAILISESVSNGYRQAQAADVVLSCAGNIGELKIVEWGSEWLSEGELRERLKFMNILYISFDGHFIYDEDNDDVRPREFEENFEQEENIVVVLRSVGSILRDKGFQWPNTLTKVDGKTISKVAEHVDYTIRHEWEERVNVWSETRTVGTVHGESIEREITIYERVAEEEEAV